MADERHLKVNLIKISFLSFASQEREREREKETEKEIERIPSFFQKNFGAIFSKEVTQTKFSARTYFSFYFGDKKMVQKMAIFDHFLITLLVSCVD